VAAVEERALWGRFGLEARAIAAIYCLNFVLKVGTL